LSGEESCWGDEGMSETRAEPGHARACLIGEFRLATEAGEALVIASRRARAMLGYLALAPEHAATRARLRGLFWADRGEAQARASLRQCLLHLRQILGAAGLDLLQVSRERVALAANLLASDVDDLREALSGEDVDRLVPLLRAAGCGRLLEDLEIEGPFREWRDQANARFDQSLATGALVLLERLEAKGDWRGVRAAAEAYLARDALDEAVAAAAIRADVALGAASAARRRFQILRGGSAGGLSATPSAAARVALYGVDEPGGPSPSPPRLDPGEAEALMPPLVVVAMFGTDDASGAEDRLAATLRDEVLSGLSRFHDLRVITDPRSLDLVAADLSAERAGAYALGASVRGGAEGRRLIVQLLRSGERHLIWAHRLVLPDLDIVETIDDIIAPVVAAVLPSIQADLMRRPGDHRADRSYTRYLLARGPDAKAQSFEEARDAAAALEALIAADPTFAPPYLPLSFLYNTDFHYTRAGSSGPPERARAFELAKTALALDRGNVYAYTTIGWCYLRRRQWRSARDHFDQALALNPYHLRRLMEIGYGLLFLGDLEAARALLDRCLLLNPSPRDGFFTDLGLLSMVRGDHERAASYFELTADPEIWGSIYPLINAQMGGLAMPGQREAAAAAIGAIWPQGTPMTADAIVAWIAPHHPFQAEAVEQRFLDAARGAFRGL
jgi:DNA-binding SARP family transcriptional activator/TolB-like protein